MSNRFSAARAGKEIARRRKDRTGPAEEPARRSTPSKAAKKRARAEQRAWCRAHLTRRPTLETIRAFKRAIRRWGVRNAMRVFSAWSPWLRPLLTRELARRLLPKRIKGRR